MLVMKLKIQINQLSIKDRKGPKNALLAICRWLSSKLKPSTNFILPRKGHWRSCKQPHFTVMALPFCTKIISCFLLCMGYYRAQRIFFFFLLQYVYHQIFCYFKIYGKYTVILFYATIGGFNSKSTDRMKISDLFALSLIFPQHHTIF